MAKILIIDEHLDWWTELKTDLEPHHVFRFWSVNSDIVDFLKKEEYEIILLSFQLKRSDSFTLLKEINQVSPQTPVIGLSNLEEADLIVKAVKKGASMSLSSRSSRKKCSWPLNGVLKTGT